MKFFCFIGACLLYLNALSQGSFLSLRSDDPLAGRPAAASITQAATAAGCPSVFFGPPLVLKNIFFSIHHVPLPSVVSCSGGTFYVTPSFNSLPGKHIYPSLVFSYTASASNSNPGVSDPVLKAYANGNYYACAGASSNCVVGSGDAGTIDIHDLQLNPNTAYSYSLCETANTTYTNALPFTIRELEDYYTWNYGAQLASASWTVSDGLCQGITIPAGTLGSISYSATCGPCITTNEISAQGIFDPRLASPGTHTITYTFVKPGCPPYVATQTIQVTNPYDASFVAPATLCQSAACVPLQPMNTYAAGSESWSGTGVAGNQFCPGATPGGSITVSHYYGISPACSDTKTTTIIVNAVSADAGPAPELSCSVPSVALQGLASAGYAWSGPGIVSGANTATPVVNEPGTYTLTTTSQGCNATATVAVSQNTVVPTLSLSPASYTLSCNNPNVIITAATSAASPQYSWTVPGQNPSGVTASVTATQAGNYSVLVTDAVNGCTNTAVSTITDAGATTASITLVSANNSLSCNTPSVVLSASSSPGSNYTWQPSGSTAPVETLTAAGTVTLIAINAASNCTASTQYEVTGNATIQAAFTAQPTNGLVPLNVNFSGGGGSGYAWSFGDGNGALSANPSYVYQQPGTYQVRLIVTSGLCTDTAYTTIYVLDALSLEIPNVFTPNGDLRNDLFKVSASGVSVLRIKIYNRWGNEVYEISTPEGTWDGHTQKGAEAPEGNYFYVARATGADGKEIERKGTISLFR